jgi:isopenicillin N synthase-like dioxygenase
VLYQDDGPGGLQVRDRRGEWVDVPPVPGSFVVNLGRLMSVWTNDRWESTLHRVVHPPRALAHRDRVSIAFFYHPNPDLTMTTIPTCAGAEGAPPPVVSGEFFLRMARRAVLLRRVSTAAWQGASPEAASG